MFKKLALSMILTVSTFNAHPSMATEKQRLAEKIKMKAFLCVYFDCPAYFMQATGLNSLIEMYGNRRAAQSLKIARADALLFAERVTLTDPGPQNTDLYRRMIVKVHPGDTIAMKSHYSVEIPINIEGLQVLDLKNGEGATLRINGRPLVSKELSAAHGAAQNLIFDGVIRAPQNEYKTATNALLLNKLIIDPVQNR